GGGGGPALGQVAAGGGMKPDPTGGTVRSEQMTRAKGKVSHPIRLTEGSPGSRILAFGGYQPSNVVTNAELAATVDTSDEWIRSRVGIASRRLAGPDETVTDMAVAAGGKALAASGLSAADIDLVIVATCTPEPLIPPTPPTAHTTPLLV